MLGLKNLITRLGSHNGLKKLLPVDLRNFLRNKSNLYEYNLKNWKLSNPLIGTDLEWEFKGDSLITVGIIYDFSQRHANYMNACISLGISYKVIDIFSNDWIHIIEKNHEIEHYFTWPSTYSNVWKTVLDERLMYLEKHFNKTVFPENLSTWIYESKRRLRDWFYLNKIKIPKTYIFYHRKEALDFLNKTEFPVVFKSDLGAGGTGVRILKTKDEAKELVNQLFYKTFIPKRLDRRETQWGFIMFQEYLKDVEEWRISRIGDAFFVRLKEKVGEFHSGSGKINWQKARPEILDMAMQVTEIGNFKSMGVDIFETPNGEIFVNEIHTVFGVKKLETDENSGKWTFIDGKWNFEQGEFSEFQFAKERVSYVLGL